ncbi:MAG: polyprenyl synthetase family protein [Pyramidobacter sp.]
MNFSDELKKRAQLFESSMLSFCANEDASIPARLREAMNYSLEAGGKRIRPVLCMAGAELFGATCQSVFPMALALEMVHTASLIHDDLPCMDNDSLRRGKPTNHKVFGETLALLAGDSLFLYAFDVALSGLSRAGFEWNRVEQALCLFARALGPAGICGGQVLDTDLQSQLPEKDFVKQIASMKTMVLIRAAVGSGALLAGAQGEKLESVMNYGEKVGLSFQISDDILDCTGSQKEMGKTLGKDQQQHKRTFVSAYGLDGARAMVGHLTQEACRQLDGFGEKAEFLRSLALYLENRSN